MIKPSAKRKNSETLIAFGINLRRLRMDKGYSQEQLANIAEISENTIVTLEAGKLNTTVATCFEIAKALGVPVRDLFTF